MTMLSASLRFRRHGQPFAITARHHLIAMCGLLATCGLLAPVARAAKPADVQAARSRIEALGAGATCVVDPSGVLTEISVQDGSSVTADDIALFGRLEDLQKLQIFNCREFDDALVQRLKG